MREVAAAQAASYLNMRLTWNDKNNNIEQLKSLGNKVAVVKIDYNLAKNIIYSKQSNTQRRSHFVTSGRVDRPL